MIRILLTIFGAMLGLAFGSFLNVCLSRWPEGESVVRPRSHCRNCAHELAWWENIPLLSWMALHGRCRGCQAWIGWRYPLTEAAIGSVWAILVWRFLSQTLSSDEPGVDLSIALTKMVGGMILSWLLVALAALDGEHLWLPDWLTWPGIVSGFCYTVFLSCLVYRSPLTGDGQRSPMHAAILSVVAILAAAGLILLTRWAYWLIRRREGIGLGDAKLMALLAAWLGLPGALLAFGLGVILGALIAVVVLVSPSSQREGESWSASKLPLGTFLCVGGIVSALWGDRIIAAYMRLSGF